MDNFVACWTEADGTDRWDVVNSDEVAALRARIAEDDLLVFSRDDALSG